MAEATTRATTAVVAAFLASVKRAEMRLRLKRLRIRAAALVAALAAAAFLPDPSGAPVSAQTPAPRVVNGQLGPLAGITATNYGAAHLVAIELPGPAIDVAAATSTSYAVLEDGSVVAWGRGDSGQLGIGPVTPPLPREQYSGYAVSRHGTAQPRGRHQRCDRDRRRKRVGLRRAPRRHGAGVGPEHYRR